MVAAFYHWQCAMELKVDTGTYLVLVLAGVHSRGLVVAQCVERGRDVMYCFN